MDVSHFPQRHDSEDNHKVTKSDSRDRLSELPDSLILMILSLLQMKDVVATTVLSKRWFNLWISVPCLDFWYHSYDLHEYRSFIYGALALWNGPEILKFTITFSYFYPRANDLDSWMLFAIEKQVAELSILLGYLRDNDLDYRPHQRLYSCSWITKLRLSYCNLKIERTVQWDQLKSLTIESAISSRSLNADPMNKVLSGVPQLEELNLFIRNIEDNFNIHSTSLKILRFGIDDLCFGATNLHADSVLRIWAPNLLTFEYLGRLRGSCLFYVPSLTNALLYFLAEWLSGQRYSPHLNLPQLFQSFCHVENVTLSNWCIKFLHQLKSSDRAVHFPNAKFLKLYTSGEIDEMLHVLEMFPNLMVLIVKLDHFPKDDYVASKTASSLLHLNRVEITWSLGYASMFPLIETLLENAHVLEKMVLRLEYHEDDPLFVLALEKVLSMPRSSPYAKVIICRDTTVRQMHMGLF